MSDMCPLHIAFTMDCDSVALKRGSRDVPRDWGQSARSIEGYCNRLLAFGFTPTLFLAYESAAEHAPMLEELAGRGVELGLLLHPPTMEHGRFKQDLGLYSAEDQRLIADFAAERFADALGVRPRSVRSGKYSASDATFKVLHELGFRQSSLSRPGWEIPRLGMRWQSAPADARYVDATNRLKPGDMPFFELPLSTDPTQRQVDNMPYELTVDAGSLEALHQPVIAHRLAAMEEAGAPFRALCISTSNRPDYYSNEALHSRTLDQVVDTLLGLGDHYQIVPVTLTGAHHSFRMLTQ